MMRSPTTCVELDDRAERGTDEGMGRKWVTGEGAVVPRTRGLVPEAVRRLVESASGPYHTDHSRQLPPRAQTSPPHSARQIRTHGMEARSLGSGRRVIGNGRDDGA